MSGYELDRWKAFHRRHPLPDPAWIGAQICAVTANVQRTKGPALKVEDFLPRVRVARSQDPDQMHAALRAAIGG